MNSLVVVLVYGAAFAGALGLLYFSDTVAGIGTR